MGGQYWRLHVQPISVMDEAVLIELCGRGYEVFLKSFDPMILVPPLNLEADGIEKGYFDFPWWFSGSRHATFLDGEQVHGTPRQKAKDALVTAALVKRGWTVQRLTYRPTTVHREIELICSDLCDLIVEELNRLGYREAKAKALRTG